MFNSAIEVYINRIFWLFIVISFRSSVASTVVCWNSCCFNIRNGLFVFFHCHRSNGHNGNGGNVTASLPAIQVKDLRINILCTSNLGFENLNCVTDTLLSKFMSFKVKALLEMKWESLKIWVFFCHHQICKTMCNAVSCNWSLQSKWAGVMRSDTVEMLDFHRSYVIGMFLAVIILPV